MFFHAPWNRIRVAHRIELLFDLLANDTLFTASHAVGVPTSDQTQPQWRPTSP